MGVYINMEMPKNGSCIQIVIDDDGKVYPSVEKCILKMGSIAKAVPVPEHGRLGDLDTLVEKIDGIWDCNDMVFSPNDHCCNIPEDCKGCKWIETKNYIRGMVANAPTIIQADDPKRE